MLDIRWMRENRRRWPRPCCKLNDWRLPGSWRSNWTSSAAPACRASRRCAPNCNIGSKADRLALPREEDRRGQRAEGAHGRDRRRDRRRSTHNCARFEAEFEDAMLRIPNPPEPDVPVAPDEEGNVVVKEWGAKPSLRLCAQAPLGAGRSAGHHRSGARRQDLGQPLLPAQGRGRTLAAGAVQLVPGRPHQRARL